MAIYDHCVRRSPTFDLPIGDALNRMLERLLKKSRNERYQTPQNALDDFEAALLHWRKHQSLDKFTIGRFKRPALPVTQELVGRVELLERVQETVTSAPEDGLKVIFVHGEPGIGKTTLGFEISRRIARQGVLVLWGQEPYNTKISAAAAFNSAIDQIPEIIQRRSPEQMNKLQRALLTLTPWAPELTRIFPKFRSIFRRAAQTNPRNAKTENDSFTTVKNSLQRRVQATIQLLKVISEHSRLFIWLDDTHRMPDSELLTMLEILNQLRDRPIRFLVTERQTETSLKSIISQLNTIHIQPTFIELSGLTIDELTTWLGATFVAEPNDLRAFAELVHQETAGNPLQVTNCLKRLQKSGDLHFNPRTGWNWSRELKFGQELRYDPDSAKSMIQSSSLRAQRLMQYAAQTTGDVDLDLMQHVPALSDYDLVESVEELVQQGILSRSRMGLRFAHESLRDAVLETTTKAQQSSIFHELYRAVLSLSREIAGDSTDPLILDASLYLVQSLSESSELSPEMLDVIVGASRQFMIRCQPQMVIDMITQVLVNTELPQQQGFVLRQQLALAFQQNNQIEHALRTLELAAGLAQTVVERSQIDNHKIFLLGLEQRYELAINTATNCLQRLGESVDFCSVQSEIEAQANFDELYLSLSIEHIDSLGQCRDTRVELISSTLAMLLPITYTYNYDQFLNVVVKFIEVILEYGLTTEGPRALSTLGQLVAVKKLDFEKALSLGQFAERLSQQPGWQQTRPVILCGLANFIMPWSTSIEASGPLNEEAYELAVKLGNWQYAGYALMQDAYNCFSEGQALDRIIRRCEQSLLKLQVVDYQLAKNFVGLIVDCCKQLRDLNQDSAPGIQIQLESDTETMIIAVKQFFIAFRDFLLGRDRAVESIRQAWLSRTSVEGWAPQVDIMVLTSVIATWSAEDIEPNFCHSEVLSFLELLDISCPRNFSASYTLLVACQAVRQGNHWQALQQFEHAIDLAIKYKRRHWAIVANHCLIMLLDQQSIHRFALDASERQKTMLDSWGVERKKFRAQSAKRSSSRRISLAQTLTFESLSSAITVSAFEGLHEVMNKVIATEGVTHCWITYLQNNKLLSIVHAVVSSDFNGQDVINVSSWESSSQQPQLLFPATISFQALNSGQTIIVNDLDKDYIFNGDQVFEQNKVSSIMAFPRFGQENSAVVVAVAHETQTDRFTVESKQRLQGLADLTLQLFHIILIESLLNDSLTRLEYMARSVFETILIVDGTGRLSGQSLISQNNEQSLSHRFGDQANKILEAIQRCKSTHNEQVAELQIDCEDHQSYFSIRVSPIKVVDSDIESEFLLVINDQTEYRNLQLTQVKLTQFQSLGMLAGGVAHDLNNILTRMNLQLSTLTTAPGSQAENVKTSLTHSLQRAEKLTEHLLQFATTNSNLSLKPIDLCQYLKHFQLDHRDHDPASPELIFQLPDQPCIVRANEVLLDQVLSNLINNALEACNSTQTVKVIARHCVADQCQLIVQDNGGGIDPELQSKIFEPLYSTKGQRSHYGLGLAIVRRAVRELDAKIQMDSQPGKGTTFVIDFACGEVVRGFDAPKPEPKIERVLVTDNEEVLRELMSEIFLDAGIQAITACGVKDTLAILETDPNIDLVVSDIRLDDGSGVDIAEALNKRKDSPAILLMTGFVSDEDLARATGICPIIRKPFSQEQILDAAREAMTFVSEEAKK